MSSHGPPNSDGTLFNAVSVRCPTAGGQCCRNQPGCSRPKSRLTGYIIVLMRVIQAVRSSVEMRTQLARFANEQTTKEANASMFHDVNNQQECCHVVAHALGRGACSSSFTDTASAVCRDERRLRRWLPGHPMGSTDCRTSPRRSCRMMQWAAAQAQGRRPSASYT